MRDKTQKPQIIPAEDTPDLPKEASITRHPRPTPFLSESDIFTFTMILLIGGLLMAALGLGYAATISTRCSSLSNLRTVAVVITGVTFTLFSTVLIGEFFNHATLKRFIRGKASRPSKTESSGRYLVAWSAGTIISFAIGLFASMGCN